jgi:hypothetical protein
MICGPASVSPAGVHVRSRLETLGFLAALLVALAPVHAADPAKTAIPDVPQGQAQIVFMRSTTVNALVGTHLYDVTTGQPKLLGKISNNRKAVVDLPPGDYVLMVGNQPFLEFMRASIAADKRYYAVIAPIWPAQWFLRPVRHKDSTYLHSSKDVAGLVKKTKYAVLEAEPLDADKAAQLADIYKVRWEKWQAKDDVEKDSFTLHPEDSVN